MYRYPVDGENLSLEQIESRAVDNGISLNSVVEGAVAHAYQEWCEPGDVVIDCGAAIGHHSFGLWRTVAPDGHVYAFDALPERIEELVNHSGQLKDAPRITFRRIALGNRTGTATFTRVVKGPGNTGYSALKMLWPQPRAVLEDFSVDIARLDHLIRPEHRGRIAFIKSDLEGGDFDALRGGRTVISRSRPLIVSEFSGHIAARTYGFTERDFFRFFDDLDYGVFDFFGQPYTPTIFASHGQGVLPQITAVPKEKTGSGVQQKIADFMIAKLRR